MFITLYAFLAWRCSVCSTAIRSDSYHDPDADELFLSISADGALVEMQSQQSRHNQTDAVPTTGAKYEATFAGTMGVSMGVNPHFCATVLINSLAAEGADVALSAIIEEEEDERDLAEQAEKERNLAEQERKRKRAEQQHKLAELIARALLRKGACVGEVEEYYDFIKVVGEGQFGTVYSATSRGDGKVVAVKEIHSNLAHFNPLEVEPPRLHLPQNSEILEVYLTQDLDISGYYREPDGTTKSLTQSGSRGFSTTKRWRYTVSGNMVTVDGTKITGVISGSAGSYEIEWSNGAKYTQQQDCFVGIWMREGGEIRIIRYQGGDGDYYEIENPVDNITVTDCEVAEWNSRQIKLLGVIGDYADGTITWRSTWSEWKKVRSPPPSISLVYVYYPQGNLKNFLTDHLRDLRERFDDETLTLAASDIHLFARQIAFGLRLLHEHGFLHRDLKPENILVVLEPGAEDYEISRHKLVITDYGTVVDGCSKRNPDCASGKTGTPYYMAKAQLEGKGKKYGAEVDWHAFGVILYQLALGMDAHPFQTKNESDAECVHNILEQQPNLDSIRGKSEYLYDLLSLLLSQRVNRIPSSRWWEDAEGHPVWSHDYWISEPNTQATKYRSHLRTVEFWEAVCAQSLSRGLDGGRLPIFPSGGVDFNTLGPEAVERCTNIGDTADWKAVTLCQH